MAKLYLVLEITVTGVNHGYHYNEISDQNGKACVEVGRSESNGADFDGDGLSNELFDVEITASSPLQTTLTTEQ